MYPSIVQTLHAIVIVAISLTTNALAAAIDSSDSSAPSQLSSSSSSSLSSSSPKLNLTLNADEIILFSNKGRVEVVPQVEYTAFIESLSLATPKQHNLNITTENHEDSASKLNKRCLSYSVFTLNPVEKYLIEDVSMSGVVRAPPSSSISISVSPGYWISNSLSTSNPITIDIIKEFLSKYVGYSLDKSWTTTYSAGYSFVVPAGKYGTIVSNPVATRYSGYVDNGCIGSSNRTEFSAEGFSSKTYSGLTWVDGIISLCLGDTYPLPRCYGNGTL